MNKCLTSEQIKTQLLEAGVQPTAQRMAICQFVLCEADHPTAEEIKQWADDTFSMMSRATVYNTLNTLVEAGMLKEVRISDSTKVRYDTNTGHHYHFYDEATGKLVDIDPEHIDIKAKLPSSMKMKEIEIVIKGTM
jgi:Fur family iron response transcriptional regulator